MKKILTSVIQQWIKNDKNQTAKEEVRTFSLKNFGE